MEITDNVITSIEIDDKTFTGEIPITNGWEPVVFAYTTRDGEITSVYVADASDDTHYSSSVDGIVTDEQTEDSGITITTAPAVNKPNTKPWWELVTDWWQGQWGN